MNIHKATNNKLQIFFLSTNTINCELGVIPLTQSVTYVLSDMNFGLIESLFHRDGAVRKLQVVVFSLYCK